MESTGTQSPPEKTNTSWSGTTVQTESVETTTLKKPTLVEEANLSFDVQKLQEATSETPTKVKIQVTNHGRTRDLNFIGTAPFSGYVGDGPVEEGLLLHPHQIHEGFIVDKNGDDELQVIPDTRNGNCWNRIDMPQSPKNNAHQITLENGQSFANTYSVLVNALSGCVDSGEYAFSNEFQIPADNVTFEWGFSLSYPVEITGRTE